MITEKEIIAQFMRNSKGIRGVARFFGLPTSYVGAIISRYLKSNNIRL